MNIEYLKHVEIDSLNPPDLLSYIAVTSSGSEGGTPYLLFNDENRRKLWKKYHRLFVFITLASLSFLNEVWCDYNTPFEAKIVKLLKAYDKRRKEKIS